MSTTTQATEEEKPKPPFRMSPPLNDFGEEFLDAHQALEETDEWYEADAMKQMNESLQ